MSKIEELIAQYCPDGVEFVELGSICDIKTGKGITKKDASEGGEYPIISGGKEPMGYYKTFNRKGNCVTISRVGANAGFISFIEKNFYLNDKCFSILLKSETNISKYLFYYLKSIESKIIDLQSEGGVPTINTTKVAGIQVIIPPLPVQEEIVNILDKFTALDAELDAELDARTRQYEYYRNQLLAFEGKDVEWKTLGEIGKVSMCKRIFKDETTTLGEIPFYKIGTFGKEPNAFISKELFNYYKKRFSYPKIGDILISASGTIGRTVIFDGKPSYFQDSNIVWIDNNEEYVKNKFLFHYYKIIKWQTDTGGVISRLYNDNIKKAKIPVPSLEEQERIVSILDKFDALVNDISVGLPAEIQARKQQYEYYRGKLLMFEPLAIAEVQ